MPILFRLTELLDLPRHFCHADSFSEELKRRNEFEQVGGTAYLTKLVESVPSPAFAQHYAEISARNGPGDDEPHPRRPRGRRSLAGYRVLPPGTCYCKRLSQNDLPLIVRVGVHPEIHAANAIAPVF